MRSSADRSEGKETSSRGGRRGNERGLPGTQRGISAPWITPLLRSSHTTTPGFCMHKLLQRDLLMWFGVCDVGAHNSAPDESGAQCVLQIPSYQDQFVSVLGWNGCCPLTRLIFQIANEYFWTQLSTSC